MAVTISRRSSYCPNFATTPDILTVVGFNKIRDGKPYGVVTTHCLGYQGRCPQWIINSPQIK